MVAELLLSVTHSFWASVFVKRARENGFLMENHSTDLLSAKRNELFSSKQWKYECELFWAYSFQCARDNQIYSMKFAYIS